MGERSTKIPNLTFPEVNYGTNETPWDLKILLYRGGAAAHSKTVAHLIETGGVGRPLLERIPLVTALHEEISSGLANGGGRDSAEGQITHTRKFFSWADRHGSPLDLENVVSAYCLWSDHLFQRTIINKNFAHGGAAPVHRHLKMDSAYLYGWTVAALLDRILDRPTSLLELTRLYKPSSRKSPIGIQAEKQNLEHTFAFGRLLQDLCDALTKDIVLNAPLPVTIGLSNGNSIVRGADTNLAQVAPTDRVRRRSSLVNLRIEAELMMFIGQTSMNLSQAQNLELRHFSYVSHLDGYQVKDRKARRNGPVLFEIYREYRPHFERYLVWRKELFPDSERIFPFIRLPGSRGGAAVDAHRLRALCQEISMAFVGARSLRNTRVNWLLRRSGDADLTSDMAQHAKKTLLEVYEWPSLQRSMVQSHRFWTASDPDMSKTTATGPGECTGSPKPVAKIPDGTARPDCSSGSGCLWCAEHRDVDTEDYVWALATFGHVKLIELSKVRAPQKKESDAPAQAALERIKDKLSWFQQNGQDRLEWVQVAQARISEGDYHPDWRHVIAQEGAQ